MREGAIHDKESRRSSGRSLAWQSAWFGTTRSEVQILSPRRLIASDVVSQIRCKSFFHGSDRFATPAYIIQYLIAADLSDAKIFRVGVRKIKPAHACAGVHRK